MVAEQIALVRELRGAECRCGHRKKEGQTFCARCYRRLDKTQQSRLYQRLGKGYEEAYADAVSTLGPIAIKGASATFRTPEGIIAACGNAMKTFRTTTSRSTIPISMTA